MNSGQRNLLPLVLVLLLCLPADLKASDKFLEVEAGVSHEELDSDYDDWNSRYMEALVRLEDRKIFYGNLRETERFSLRDTELKAGMYYPLGQKATALLEGNRSWTHHVLPEWSALGQVELALPRGWSSALGFRRTEYPDALVNQATVSINKYWSSYLASYTFYASRVEGAGSGESHRLQLYYLYGGDSRASVGYTTGREVEKLGDGDVLVSDIQTITLYGLHWFGHDWAVSWEMGEHRQGDWYTRRGGRIGLRYAY